MDWINQKVKQFESIIGIIENKMFQNQESVEKSLDVENVIPILVSADFLKVGMRQTA